MQETVGAAFRDDLHVPHAELVLRKGYHREIDSYSAFYENDRKTATGLTGYLRERGFTRIFLAGLAFDFCVRYSGEDARRQDFEVVVIEDACRSIDVDGSAASTRDNSDPLASAASPPASSKKQARAPQNGPLTQEGTDED